MPHSRECLNTSSGGWAQGGNPHVTAALTQNSASAPGNWGRRITGAPDPPDREPPTARCGEREPIPSSGVGSTPRSGKWESRGWEGRGKEGVILDLNTTNSLCSCDFRSFGGVVCRVPYAVKAELTLNKAGFNCLTENPQKLNSY